MGQKISASVIIIKWLPSSFNNLRPSFIAAPLLNLPPKASVGNTLTPKFLQVVIVKPSEGLVTTNISSKQCLLWGKVNSK